MSRLTADPALPSPVALAVAIALAALLLLLGPASPAAAATITVTSTADANPPVNSDGCTLREAILAANTDLPVNECAQGQAFPVTDVIEFDIAAAGVQTINVTSGGLPPITGPVTIDGYTQNFGASVASPNTLAVGNDAVLLIELNGATAGWGRPA